MKDQARAEQINKVFNQIVPSFLKQLDPYLRNGAFLLGKNISHVDFWVGMLYVNFFKKRGIYEQDKWDALARQYPLWAQYGERFSEANKTYLKSRALYDY